ncbi:MAG TPA: flagellar biosynthesis protein FlhA [Albitalea sp.]|uniref:flagellar biosynthesis protein FlhA n=1 Tax=Piscinibacter sp. TaxID=1903157 RepID=UPI002ED1B224
MSAASLLSRVPPAWRGYASLLSPRVESVLGLAVVGVVFMMVLPLPHAAMDVLIAFNLFAAAFLIVLSLYVKAITSFTAFPVVLLISTLYRLGIEISATRMILLEADAGAIVETFGNFVVGGNLVVGLVIFLIVTIVQFIVVTKGAERISEVSARFTLDAMPAKQMSIENELRGNHIDKAEAKRQRQLLDTETTLLGAMDGTLKFVKGDSIAGLVIVVVNLIGGLAIGIFVHNMSAGEAMLRYSILTIGEGLVAQIPGLLSSMTAAILVSRVSSAEARSSGMSFGSEMLSQMAQPAVMNTVAVTMVCFSLIPGMPTLAFLGLAGASAGLAYVRTRKQKAATAAKPDQRPKRAEETAMVTEFNQMDALQLALPTWTRDDPQVQKLITGVIEGRNKLVLDQGMSIPSLVTKYDPALAQDTLEFRVYEVPVYRSTVRLGWVAVGGPHAERMKRHDDAVFEPGGGVAGTNIVWLPQAAVAGDPDLEGAATPWHVFIADRIYQRMVKHTPRFTGIQTGQKYMTWMEGWMPDLAKELEKAIPVSRLAEVVQRLLKERVAIRNMRTIMETLADHGQRERDTGTLVELVRAALREQICHQLAPDGHLDVFVLTPELEEYLTGTIRQTATGGFLALNPHETGQLTASIRATIGAKLAPGKAPVLVCAQDIRRYMRTLLENEFSEISILSLNELTPEVSVRVIGTIEANPPSEASLNAGAPPRLDLRNRAPM